MSLHSLSKGRGRGLFTSAARDPNYRETIVVYGQRNNFDDTVGGELGGILDNPDFWYDWNVDLRDWFDFPGWGGGDDTDDDDEACDELIQQRQDAYDRYRRYKAWRDRCSGLFGSTSAACQRIEGWEDEAFAEYQDYWQKMKDLDCPGADTGAE